MKYGNKYNVLSTKVKSGVIFFKSFTYPVEKNREIYDF